MQNEQNNNQNGTITTTPNPASVLQHLDPKIQLPVLQCAFDDGGSTPQLSTLPSSRPQSENRTSLGGQQTGGGLGKPIQYPESSNQHPPIHQSTNPPIHHPATASLLDELERVLSRHVVLPDFAAETLALWTLHTHAYECRDVTTYIGIESPEKRCGKTTLLSVLSELVNRPVVAANISSPAFFRVIEETQPTLLIDEADTFLHRSDELRGIFNAGYKKKTCYVWRVANEWKAANESAELNGNGNAAGATSRVAKFSVWCPKFICTIGRLPDILADRCIVIRMQRKREDEICERLRDFDGTILREKCQSFVSAHRDAIAAARPTGAEGLNDRATDIWEPLFALADLAGGPWPEKARRAASGLTKRGHESNPIGSLLIDILEIFLQDFAQKMSDAQKTSGEEAGKAVEKAQLTDGNRLFSRKIVDSLNCRHDRPWRELLRGKEVTELWLSQRVRPYGVRPRIMRIGDQVSRGYEEKDFWETFRRYIPRHEIDEFRERFGRKT
jgi:hypothetical protein